MEIEAARRVLPWEKAVTMESKASGPSGLPLADFTQVNTRWPDEAEDAVGRIFCAHRLMPTRRSAPGFHAVHNHVQHDRCSINYVAYGAEVTIDPGRLDRFFLLQIPLSGGSEVRCGSRTIETGPLHASLLSPTLETRLHWSAGTGQLILLIERKLVEGMLAALTDRAPEAVEFCPSLARDTPEGVALQAQVALMCALAERMPGGSSGTAQRQLRDAVVGQLLALQPHNLSHRLDRPVRSAAPAHVRRAEEYIAAHAAEDFSLLDLTEVCGVSLRTLQTGFRRFRETTISGRIIEVRLANWKRLLENPSRSEGVVELAIEAGIPHPGRWAAAFRRRYGLKPSEAYRRARVGKTGFAAP